MTLDDVLEFVAVVLALAGVFVTVYWTLLLVGIARATERTAAALEEVLTLLRQRPR